MRVEEAIYFSPKYKFEDIDWNDKDKLIEAFKDRVNGFYLKPAEVLNSSREYGFAAGLLCASTIDFLARISIDGKYSGKRIKKWLCDNITEFKETEGASKKFYDDF